MVVIFKYPLEVTDVQDVEMPFGASILCIQVQHNVPCLWAQVLNEAPMRPVRVRIYGTGHQIQDSDSLRYIGTFPQNGGALMFHVFEELPA